MTATEHAVYTTRLNPSINGPLHVGHIYTALVNEAIAHASGGRFLVRFADMHAPSLASLGRARMDEITTGMVADLAWLDLKVDGYYFESVEWTDVHGRLNYLSQKHGFPVFQELPMVGDYAPTPLWIGGVTLVYPYTSYLTAEKVLLDYDEGVNLLVRGEDLTTEYALYCYYCQALDLPILRQIFLPRLRMVGGGEISKSMGGAPTVAALRAEGYAPADVKGKLAAACLKNPANGWELINLKERPEFRL